MEKKEQIIEAILGIELEMFLNVSPEQPNECRNHPEAFKFHRRLQFSVWSAETLAAYQKDLLRARQSGDNLMILKYARMQGLLPRRNTNPLIDDIVHIKIQWQKDMVQKYPAVMNRARQVSGTDDNGRMTSFETYIRGELETYSDETLSLLYADMRDMQEQGVNGSERIYQLQVEHSGFPSLDAAEAHMKQRAETPEL